MKESQAVDALSALSQATRLQILRFLVTKGEGGASAGEIGQVVSASSSRASFHLSCLSGAQLITATRISRNIIYKANFTMLGELMGYLVKDCCNNHKLVVSCCNSSNCC